MKVKPWRAWHVSGDEKDPTPPEPPPPSPDDGDYDNPGDTEVRWAPPMDDGFKNPGVGVPQLKKIPTLKTPKGGGLFGI